MLTRADFDVAVAGHAERIRRAERNFRATHALENDPSPTAARKTGRRFSFGRNRHA